ncbi:hypothetical protein LZ480_14425 [Solibacillus sp. MA9]|uniref:Uncharacterized protein n=1 Tax=Solibacillus palustris TaxID=2908203 RepID=A0ABS9UFE1_9BACL|nr:hypothetical protein [Solibacillus sp. MA9]MCH7323071.1 hypothetical protein [Solibacillus sp. MA9]
MQEQMSSQAKELICINVEKVYDWVVKELSFESFPTSPIRFPGLPHDAHTRGASVTCQVCPSHEDPVVIKNRETRTFTIEGSSVRLQQLTIQKNFKVTICITLANGTMYTSDSFHISRSEHVVMCAPEGTNVDVTYTNLDCFVSSTGTLHNNGNHTITFSDLALSISVCQSIQSTFPVTVEFYAKYCEPRADLSAACSPGTRPPNCSVVFP